MSPRGRSLPARRLQLAGLIICGILIYAYSHWGVSTTNRIRSNLTSISPLPVHHLTSLIHYENNPVSIHRPSAEQFAFNHHSKRQDPVVMLITAAHNPRPVILETAKSILHQSLTNFEWVIVNDQTTDENSLKLLAEVAMDPRVTVLVNTGKGLCAARNTGVDYGLAKATVPRYFLPIDDDDLFELTALEKLVWVLESNEEWSLAGHPFIKFGADNLTEVRGLHNGQDNFHVGNFVPNTAMFRSAVLATTGCRYDPDNFSFGGEDWDVWMCMAENGYWGGTLPEFLYWYRVNPSTFRNARWGNTFVDGFAGMHAKLKAKHSSLAAPGAFPVRTPRLSSQLEPISWELPYQGALDHSRKAIMFVVPWLYAGDADIAALHMIQLFVEAGYRVTVVCTLFKNPEGMALRPYALMWTHDVHVLPQFLRANDMPRFIKHLILSRGIDEVVLSNSQLMYELLPALTEQLPNVRFIDYLHNEAHDGWKSHGFSSYSTISQRYLARTIVCSEYLKQSLIESGHAADRIGVVKLGLEVAEFTPATDEERVQAQKVLLGVKGMTIITTIARFDSHQRTLLIPDIAIELRRLGVKDFIILVIGEGDLLGPLTQKITSLKLDGYVRVLDKVKTPRDYLVATDIFLTPSKEEGMSNQVAEAMAMAIPIIAARAGASPEQLGSSLPPLVLSPSSSFATTASQTESTESIPVDEAWNGSAGILVEHTLVDATDATLYAQALLTLLSNRNLRQQYGNKGRERIEQHSDWRTTLGDLFSQLDLARVAKPNIAAGDNPSAHFAIQNLLLEERSGMDFAAYQSSLRLPPRLGAGLILQRACSETEDGTITSWIDALATPIACPSSPKPSFTNLIRSAEQQCSDWCIFDLTTPEYVGWSFNGNCLVNITQTPHCKNEFIKRPKILLEELETSEDDDET